MLKTFSNLHRKRGIEEKRGLEVKIHNSKSTLLLNT